MRMRSKEGRAFLGVALGLGALAGSVAAGRPSDDGAGALLVRAAEDGLHALARRSREAGVGFDPDELMRYALPNFFAAYPTATAKDEQERLIRTLERIVQGLGSDLLADAAVRAARAGRPTIRAPLMAAVVRDRLRPEPTAYDELSFFSHRGLRRRVTLELVDLEAMRDTGLAWRVMRELGRSEERGARRTAIEDDAVPLLAEALASYGLLVLRLGGGAAREAQDPEVASPHLREAERRLRALASEGILPPLPDPLPAQGPWTDVTEASALHFRHTSSTWISRFRRYGPSAPTFSGGGVTAADLDGDRLPDLVFCGGRGCSAFRNRGDGTFADVTETSGIRVGGEGRMAVAGDFDNDGDADLFLTYARDPNRLFENLGGARFRDVTEASGLARPGDINGGAVAFDADNDGRLDLYVANFGDYMAGQSPFDAPDARNGQPNRLFRNRGGLVFEEATEKAGVGDTGWAQAVSAADLDGDGWTDLYVANDFGRNELYRNRGNLTFEAVGAAWGADCPFHGMNVAFADLNRDGSPEIMISNIWGWSPAKEAPDEYNILLVSRREGKGLRYERQPPKSFLETDTGWAWGALFFDIEHDGDDDLFMVNGHSDYGAFVQFRRHPTRPGQLYPITNGREPNLLYLNEGGRLLTPSARTAAALPEENSRGLALLDYDADGDLDMAVSTFHSRGRLFANREAKGNWIMLELEGDPARGVSRDAIGAQVTVRGEGGLQIWRTVTAGEGYLSQSARAVHAGVGPAKVVDLEVRWPGGGAERHRNVPVNGWIGIRQGEGRFRNLERPGTAARRGAGG